MRTHPNPTMGAELLSTIALEFEHARRSGRRLPILSERYPELDLASAEQIARLTTELCGSPVIGYKLGYTSQVMRDQMRIASPNWGFLTRAMDINQSPVPLLIHPRIEPEIAVVLGRDITTLSPSLDDVEAAVRSVHLALEIIDTRFEEYRFTLEDNTADASSAAAFIVGPAHPVSALGSMAEDEVFLFEDGTPIGSGKIADVMGGPLAALQWLASQLHDRCLPLTAGMVVMTGGLTSAAPVGPNRTYRASQRHMHDVSCNLGNFALGTNK